MLIIGGSFTTLNGADNHAWLINGNNIPSGIENIDGSLAFSISPNPGTDYFNFKTGHSESISRVNIYDLQGRLLKEINQHGDLSISTNDLLAGMYFIRCYKDNGEASGFEKWVKQ